MKAAPGNQRRIWGIVQAWFGGTGTYSGCEISVGKWTPAQTERSTLERIDGMRVRWSKRLQTVWAAISGLLGNRGKQIAICPASLLLQRSVQSWKVKIMHRANHFCFAMVSADSEILSSMLILNLGCGGWWFGGTQGETLSWWIAEILTSLHLMLCLVVFGTSKQECLYIKSWFRTVIANGTCLAVPSMALRLIYMLRQDFETHSGIQSQKIWGQEGSNVTSLPKWLQIGAPRGVYLYLEAKSAIYID